MKQDFLYGSLSDSKNNVMNENGDYNSVSQAYLRRPMRRTFVRITLSLDGPLPLGVDNEVD